MCVALLPIKVKLSHMHFLIVFYLGDVVLFSSVLFQKYVVKHVMAR